MKNLLLFNKPYNVLCQFSGDEGKTLKHYISVSGFYPAGRLDKDSEGLMLLTNNGKLQNLISHPRHKWQKSYWVQVEGEIDEPALNALRTGIELKDGPTQATTAKRITEPDIWPRTPPIRERKAIPTSWLQLELREGRNRQVRRMTAAVGFPTLRLIRCAVGPFKLNTLQPGKFSFTHYKV